MLFDLGLKPALEWLAEDMQRTYGLRVNVTEVGHVPRTPLDETVSSVLFRCVRELLANVARHAKVDAADVDLPRRQPARGGRHRRRRRVRSGIAGATRAQGRFGLVSVRERIGFVNGTLAVDANPGDGTIATLTVPLTAPDAPDPRPQ